MYIVLDTSPSMMMYVHIYCLYGISVKTRLSLLTKANPIMLISYLVMYICICVCHPYAYDIVW